MSPYPYWLWLLTWAWKAAMSWRRRLRSWSRSRTTARKGQRTRVRWSTGTTRTGRWSSSTSGASWPGRGWSSRVTVTSRGKSNWEWGRGSMNVLRDDYLPEASSHRSSCSGWTRGRTSGGRKNTCPRQTRREAWTCWTWRSEVAMLRTMSAPSCNRPRTWVVFRVVVEVVSDDGDCGNLNLTKVMITTSHQNRTFYK